MLIVDFLVFSQRGDQSAELSGCLIIWSCLGTQTNTSRLMHGGERLGQEGSIQDKARLNGISREIGQGGLPTAISVLTQPKTSALPDVT